MAKPIEEQRTERAARVAARLAENDAKAKADADAKAVQAPSAPAAPTK